MWNKTLKVLSFLRVTEGNRLSLTNIALAIVLYRVCFATAIDTAELISLAVTLGGYQGKKLLSKWPSKLAATAQDELGTAIGIDSPDEPSKK